MMSSDVFSTIVHCTRTNIIHVLYPDFFHSLGKHLVLIFFIKIVDGINDVYLYVVIPGRPTLHTHTASMQTTGGIEVSVKRGSHWRNTC